MDRADRYIYETYKRKSFSRAATALYISQPSLSATVKKREEELGFAVFDRTKIPLGLTREGQIYIEYLEDVHNLEWNMNHRIKNLTTELHEKLTVGGTDFAAQYLLPILCGEFHHRYPDTEIKIDACNGGSFLFDKLKKGVFELAVSHRCDDPLLESVPLMEDPLIIVMRDDTEGIEKALPYAMTRDEALNDSAVDKEYSDYSIFSDIEFIHIGKSSSIWKYMPGFTENYSVSNCRVENSRRFDMHYDMMVEGMGAVITSESVILARRDRGNLVYFKSKSNREEKRNLLMVYKKGIPLSKTASDFIDLAVKMCADKSILFS